MPQYDAKHWQWGAGFCEKHRGQSLPCRPCIESGDCEITEDAVTVDEIEVDPACNVRSEQPASDRYSQPEFINEIVDIKTHWRQTSGDPNAKPTFQEEVTAAVNALPKGNPCAEIMLPSDDGIGGRLAVAKGMFQVFIDGKLVGAGENLVIKATGKLATMHVNFGAGTPPMCYGVPGPDGEIRFIYNPPVTREQMKPGHAYQHYWGETPDHGRQGFLLSQEDIEKCLVDTEAWVLEGCPSGPANVDQVGVAGDSLEGCEQAVKLAKKAAILAFDVLVAEIKSVIGSAVMAAEATKGLRSPQDCLNYAARVCADHCMPWDEHIIRAWAERLTTLWETWTRAKQGRDAVRAIQFGKLYGGDAKTIMSGGAPLSVDEATKVMRDFEAKYPGIVQMRKKLRDDNIKDAFNFQPYLRKKLEPPIKDDGAIKPNWYNHAVLHGQATAIDGFSVQEIGGELYHVRDGWVWVPESWGSTRFVKLATVEQMRDRVPTMIVRDETSAFKNRKHLEAVRRINEQGRPVQEEQPARPRDDRGSTDVGRHDPDAD